MFQAVTSSISASCNKIRTLFAVFAGPASAGPAVGSSLRRAANDHAAAPAPQQAARPRLKPRTRDWMAARGIPESVVQLLLQYGERVPTAPNVETVRFTSKAWSRVSGSGRRLDTYARRLGAVQRIDTGDIQFLGFDLPANRDGNDLAHPHAGRGLAHGAH